MSTMHEDLKAIRENLKMSIQDVYEKTRISAENIRLIESGELYNRPDANKIYLRSFTRTYAKAVGVSDEDITTALDYMEADMYEGFLAEKYLGNRPEPTAPKVPPKPPFPKNPVSDTPTGQKDDDDRVSESPPPRSEQKKIRRASTRTTSIFAPAIPGREPLSPADEPADESVDWADVNKKMVSRKDGNGLLIFLGLLGIILVAALIYMIYMMNTANGDELDAGVATVPGPRIEQPMASDTLGAPLAPDPAQLATALPDTLLLTVYAARGNLEPVRILSDLFNIQRPYWVEAGRAMQFEFLQDIQIRGNLERMILMYDNRIITDYQQYDAENRVISISREQFLRDPTMRSFSTDVMPDNLPRPVEILERPRL